MEMVKWELYPRIGAFFSDGDGEMGVVSENWGVFSDREGGTGVRCG